MSTLRLTLILLLSFSFLAAKSKDSCYSVQLTSFTFKKDSTYKFEEQDYPRTCKLISFTNMNAVRCGCFDTYQTAKKQHKIFQPDYNEAKIVTTYKYRFAPKRSIVHTRPIKEVTLITDTSVKEELNPEENKPTFIREYKKAIRYSKIKTKKVLLATPNKDKEISEKIPDQKKKKLSTSTKPIKIKEPIKIIETKKEEEIIIAEVPKEESYDILKDITIQGNVDLTSQAYLSRPNGKHSNNFTASAELEMAYSKDDFQFFTKFKAQQDYYDLVGGDDETDRSFLRLDELYGTYDFENDQIMFGKSVRFWGALEVRNFTDTFNPDDLRTDSFAMDKLGVWNAAYTHFTETGEFSIIAKFYEQDRNWADFPYVYYFFPESVPVAPGVELPFVYDKNLITEKSSSRPSIYLKYSGSTDTEYPLDYAFLYENGYDSQRYYTQTPASDGLSVTTNENAYLVNKISTYNTLVLGSTLVKLEAQYTDVIDNDIISDYYQIGLGVEHTLTQVYKEADLGLISEYYRYETLEKDKRNDLQLFELFQNDLFLGLRYSFNQGNDMSIVTGAILDLDYNEQVYYFEYEGRIADTLKINFDYRYIAPSSDYTTAFKLMGKHQRLSLTIGYYF